MKEKISLKGMWEVLKNSFKGLGEDKITKMAGSLAYYTVFSMGPLLVVTFCAMVNENAVGLIVRMSDEPCFVKTFVR